MLATSLLLLSTLTGAAPFSTTAWTTYDATFANIVSAHFDAAQACWKQKRIPSAGLMRNETLGIIEAQQRFWPGKEEYRLRLLAFMLSEGGGLPDGNPEDPSFGVLCVYYDSGRYACWFWGIPAPRGRQEFIDRLKSDSRFNILVGAAELAHKEWQSGGDWMRAVCQVKYGSRRFGAIQEALKDRPITELPPARHYLSVLQWVRCLANHIENGILLKDCACLPPS